MKNPESKSKDELIKENEVLQQKVKELEKTEEQFRIIAESTSDNIAITTFDLKAKYIYVSPSVKHVLGYDPKDLLGKSFFDFIHPDDKKVLLPLVKKYINLIIGKVLRIDDPKITETIEFRFKDKAGKWHYMQSTVNFIGKNLLAVTRDITERKQAQEEIINSEKKFRILTESAPIGIYYNDLNGTFLYGNKRAEEIIGYKQDEMIRKNFLKLKLLNPQHILKAVKLLALNKLGKSTGPDNFTLNTKDGAQRQVEISTTIINIEGKEVVLGMVQDITDRKRAEEALRESEEKYRTIFESSPEAIVLFDKKGNVIDINDRIEDWLGYKPGDIARKNFAVFPFLSNRSKALALKKISQRMSGKEIPPFELEFTDKNGEKRIGLTTASIIKDEKGKIIQNLIMISDITERKKVEEELAKHREHLEELVEKRTDELEKSQNSLTLLLEDVNDINQDLRDANTMLNATNKELEAFSYSVSHDLRAPLTRMDGFSKALLTNYSGKLDDQGVHYLNRIRASSQYMAKLIDNLLLLSRITRGIVTRQKVDLSQTTTKIAEELKASEPDREVEFKIAKGLCAKADLKIVEILLENLLGNSFKFTGKKENAVIEFSEKIIDDKEVFFIKDNGAGFNMKYYDKIFAAFQRLHSDEEFKGIGIGLAIVQRIINKHGGKIWAESEIGEGTTFYFRFE